MEQNYLMKILPILLQNKECNLKINPSEFIREMNLTTEERTETLLHCNRRLLTNVIHKGFPHVLEPSLPIIIFQNFRAEIVYTIPLSILNKDKITRSCTISCEKSPYFAIRYCEKALVKVAPGISEKFLIEFSPRQRKDYHHVITINSINGNLEIPIYAIGPRPLLDFPDKINFSNCSIRIPNTKIVCVFNIGEIDAIFTLDIKGPFTVQPRSYAIKPGNNLQISVIFQSAKPGKFMEYMEITLQTGEKLHSQVHAVAENNYISLTCNRLNFEDTYIGLSRHKELSIKNNGSYPVSYRWLNYSTCKEDCEIYLESNKHGESFTSKEDFRANKFVEKEMRNELSIQCDYDIGHYLDCAREDKILFNHKNFRIEPKGGDILPGNSIDVQVLFMPNCGPKLYEEIALFESSGCEDILTLQLHGQGLGPNICILLQLLDVGEIFIKMKYSYEVVVANKGDIPGKIKYVPTKLDFGGVIECEPKCFQLGPGEHKAFALSYIAYAKGEFIEEVTFKILESQETRRLMFKGHASYGELEIGSRFIDLGNLPLGLPASTDFVIYNPCPIPITYYAYIREKEKDLPEFKDLGSDNLAGDLTIDPNVGCLEPYQALNATIKVIVHTPKKSFDVIVETWNGLAVPRVIPIKYQIEVPDIKLKPGEINLSYCFVNFPYSCSIQLNNPSEYPARFIILPQQVENYESMTVLPDQKEGIINGLMKVDIHLSVMVHKIGKFSTFVKVKITGLEDILVSKIVGEGQGPIVTTNKKRLDWDKIFLFNREIRYFQLHNHSPIPADFVCEMVRGIPFWAIDHLKGTIGPNDAVTVMVELYMTDSGHYQDTIDILIRNSGSLSVNLYATGFGNPIHIEPSIYPFLDLGDIFSSSNYKKELFLKNYGIKTRILEIFQPKKRTENKSPSRHIFKFHPQKLILHPGQKQSIFIEANHESIEEVKETLLIWCAEYGKGNKEKIFEGFVKATFILFHLDFPSESLHLVSYKGDRPREFFIIRNDTSLAVKSMVEITPPFKLLIVSEGQRVDSLEIDVLPFEEMKILVEFRPLFQDKKPRKCHGKLIFSFADIGKMYVIEITGDVKYPHLSFDIKVLDFGCISIGTTSQRQFKITNNSPFPVKFEWKWTKGSVTIENKLYDELDTKSKKVDKHEFSLHIFDSLLRYVEKEKERYLNMMQFPEITRFFREEEDILPFLTSSIIENGISPPVSWVFEVIPKYGELEPGCSEEISLLFRGYTSLEAFADLQCIIEEGECDTIKISAKSSNISYLLDKTYINFGEKLFCKTCFENIEMKNNGEMEFYYQSDLRGANNPTDTMVKYQLCSLALIPDRGHVPGHSTSKLEVSFYPGLIGPIKGSCFVQIGEMEPIKIDVEAFGVFPQIFVHLPKDIKPLQSKPIASDEEYVGIANMNESHSLTENYSSIEEDLIRNYESDWEIVTYEDGFPTIQEICLAIEKHVAAICIRDDFDLLPTVEKYTSIPGCVVTPNIVDMDTVLIGEERTYSVLLENCSSLVALVYLTKESKETMARAGLTVSIPWGNKLQPGIMAAIYISLLPIKEIYPHKFQKIDLTLFFEVSYGSRIPIRVMANITYPFLIVNKKSLNFGEVKCGHCKALQFEFTNVGWVDCSWKVESEFTSKKDFKKMPLTPDINQKSLEQSNPYSISPQEGNLSPSEHQIAKVFFKPPYEGLYKGRVIINIDKNNSPIILKINGTGLDPVLNFNKSVVLFDPLIPLAQTSKQVLTIENPNKYPVEIFLPAFDRQRIEKELIFNILLHHYQVEDILIPMYGKELPQEYKEFLNWKMESLQEEMQKQNNDIIVNESAGKSQRKAKSSKSRKSPNYSVIEEKQQYKSATLTDSDQLALRENLLNRYTCGEIKELKDEKKIRDPIKDVMNKISSNFEEKAISTSPHQKGAVYIFHGAPFSDYVHLAHRASRYLEKPVMDLDTILLREIVLGSSSASVELKKLLDKKINDFYLKFSGNDVHQLPLQIKSSPDMSEEEFSKRLATYLYYSSHSLSPSKENKNSKASKPLQKGLETILWSDIPDNLYFPSIPAALIEGIWTARLCQPDCSHGFVIPKLKSIFFQNLEDVLTSILKVIHGIYSIEVIFINNSFEQQTKKLRLENKFRVSKIFSIPDIKENDDNGQIKDVHEFENLLSLDVLYGNNLIEPDPYLMKIKHKIHQLRKFSRINEFAESELQKDLSNKKIRKNKDKRKGSNDPRRPKMTSKASKKSTSASLFNEGVRASKRASTVIEESKIMSKASSKISTIKFSASEVKSESPASGKVLPDDGIEDTKESDLKSQFDIYSNMLMKLLLILENWPLKSTKKSVNKQKPSQLMKGKSSKMSKKSTSALSEEATLEISQLLSKDVGIPVVILNSPSIEAASTKKFLEFKFAKKNSQVPCPADISIVDYIGGKMKHIEKETTYIHIRKSCINEKFEKIDDVFTVKSLDSLIVNESLETKELTGILGIQESSEQLVQEYEKDGISVVSENKITTYTDDRKTDKLNGLGRKNPSKDLKKSSKEGMIARHVLQPQETVHYVIDYHPQEKGEHSASLSVVMEDWPKRYEIEIHGLSDIPEIDRTPERIFEKCAEEKPKTCPPVYTPTYFHDINVLDFGLILVEKKLDEQYTRVVSKLAFHNVSQVTVLAEFQLDKDASKAFSMDRDSIEVKAKEVGYIHVKAFVKRTTCYSGTLVCTIRDNKDKMLIKLCCLGFLPEIEILPKQLQFDPVLLFHRKRLQFTLKNKCAMTFSWKVSSSDFACGDEFDVIPNNGILPCFSSLSVEVEFLPSKVQPLFKKPLQIEFYHPQEGSQVLIAGSVTVSAESYDILIDLHFAEGNDSSGKKAESTELTELPNHLNFDVIKACMQKNMLVMLRNNGRYDVLYKFVVNKEYPRTPFDNNIYKIFTVKPDSGILAHGSKSPTIIEVSCLPENEFKVDSIPIYVCQVNDANISSSKNDIVANIPIFFSLTSVFSKYSIFPSQEQNFGPVKINTQSSSTFSIHNKGIFDFTFSVINAELLDQVNPKSHHEKVPSSATLKKGSTSKNLKIGCFTITPITGTVLPNESAIVTVFCLPVVEGKKKEVVQVYISNTPAAHKDKLNLVVNSCIPSINFFTPEEMFMEHIICEDFRAFKWPPELNQYTIYSKKNNELAFKNVLVGSCMKARLFLRNASLINTSTKISILPLKEKCKIGCQHYNGKCMNSHEECKQFSVKPAKLTIPPCSGKWIRIMFTPTAMEVYAAMLCISVDEESNEKFDDEREESESDDDMSEDVETTDEEDEAGEDIFEKIKSEECKIIAQNERENLFEDEDKESGKVEMEAKDKEREARFRENTFKHIIAEEKEWNELSFSEEGVGEQGIGYDGGIGSEEKKEGGFANDDRFSWCCLLSGEGFLPLLKLTHPLNISEHSAGKYSIILPPVNVGSTKLLKFGFQNISYVFCKVVIKLTGRKNIFIIYPTDSSSKLNKKFHTNVPWKNITKVNMEPREEIMFEILINARFPGVFTEEISIIPVGNPFGLIIITVEAECIRNGIILDGLTYVDEYLSILPDTTKDSSSLEDKNLSSSGMVESLSSADKLFNLSDKDVHSSSENSIVVKHLLEFRENNAAALKVKEFSLVNYSQISYDFKWIGLESIPELQLTPRTGVLRPLSSELISAAFSSNNPVWSAKVIIKCFLERAVEYCHIEEDIYKLFDDIQFKDLEEENIMKLIESNTLIVSDFSERNKLKDKDDKTSEEILTDDYHRNEDGSKMLQEKSLELKKSEQWEEAEYSSQVEDIGKDYLLLPFLFQATINYASYSCDICSEICFGTVAVGMSNSFNVMLMNTGKVPLKFHWKFEALNALINKSVDKESVKKAEIMEEIHFKTMEKVSAEVLIETEEKCTDPEDVYDPFFAIPSKGELYATGDFIECKIIFSPLEFGDYESSLVCRIENLAPGIIGPTTLLKGKVRHLPYYFNYEDIDFSNNTKREEVAIGKQTDLVSSSIPGSRLASIEIQSTGVGHTIHKTLEFYNCTDKKAVFNWKNMDSVAKGVSEWRCSKLSGVVPPRSKIPMKFSFTPLKIGFFESFWSFSIFDDDRKVKFPKFHLIGISSEPAVYFLPGHINIKLYYQGKKLSKDIFLINEEDIPLKFHVDVNSCSLKNEKGMLKIEPVNGLLDPHSKHLIRVKYLPKKIGVTAFHVKFLIERRPMPLVLTVKCGSYELLPEVEFHESSNSVKHRLILKEINSLNLREVREGESCQGFFEISNKGNIAFKYDWNYNEDLAKKVGLDICFSPLEEIVYPASTVTCSVSLSLAHTSNVEKFKILLKISQGPHYIIYLSMVAKKPKCMFSFKSYDFGKCIVPPSGILPKFKEAILSIKGKDKGAIMLESKFQPMEHLIADLEKTVLLFDEEIQVPIKFCPQEMLKYKEKIPFVINEKWEKIIVVKGEGISFKLELVNPNQKCIDFKCVDVGCKVSKKISVRNYTEKSIDVSFKIRKHVSEVESNLKCLEDESSSGRSYPSHSSLNDGSLELVPHSEVSLKRGDIIKLHVTFSPIRKLTYFSKEIVAIVRDLEGEIPLCIIHGRSKNVNVALTSRYIQFGNVVRGSSCIQVVSLVNNGNERTKYQWDTEGLLDSQFSITPTSGYCCPGQNVSFKVTFTPSSLNKLIECKIICDLQGQRNLPLELSGRGTELPLIKETIHFSSSVREKESKSVSIANRSGDVVEVRPLLKGEYFFGADVLVINPSTDATYLITFAPMTLTKEGTEHHGILYLRLPNGDEHSWNLIGTAKPPSPNSEVKQRIQCKVWHEEILTVQNWLPIPQRFHVTSELMPGKCGEPIFYISGFVKNLKSNESIISNSDKKEGVRGAELKKKKSKGKSLSVSSSISTKNLKLGDFGEPGGYLDVPGNGFSQYKLKFICYEECSLDFKVIFTNQNTGEYLYHIRNFTVEDNASPQVIEINTIVRKESFKKLEIENPFPTLTLTFNVRTELSFIFVPETITVAPKQKETIHLRCLPLHEGYCTAPLLISCPELGVFNYELRVNVEYAVTKECKEMYFNTPLGRSETLFTPPFLHNYSDKPASFNCVVDSEAFILKEIVQVMPHAQKALKVTFEPTDLGSFCATLSCKSIVAGSFFHKLKGICIPPKIEGPYIVKANSDGTDIVFKNVFTEATEYSFRATEPFQLDSNLKILEPKEETVIHISFDSNTTESDEVSKPTNGLLVISLTDEMPQKIKWEYYLKGIVG